MKPGFECFWILKVSVNKLMNDENMVMSVGQWSRNQLVYRNTAGKSPLELVLRVVSGSLIQVKR